MFQLPEEYLVGRGRFFGDYQAAYLAGILGYQNEAKIVEVGVAHLFGRAFVIAQDRILDNPTSSNRDYIIAAPLLLQAFFERNDSIATSEKFSEEMERVILESAKENLSESRKKRTPAERYSGKDLLNVWKKTGAFTIAAKSFRFLAKGKKSGALERIVENVLVAIQICDDLSDLQEDAEQGNYTIILSQLIQSDKRGSGKEFVFSETSKKRAIGFIQTASRCLDRAIRKTGQLSGKPTLAESYFKRLRTRLQTTAEEISEATEDQQIKRMLRKLEPGDIAPIKLMESMD